MLVLLNCSTYFCHGDSNCVRLFVSIFFRWRFDKRESQIYTYICWYKPNEPYIPNTLSPHPHTLHTHIRTNKMQDKQQLKSRTDSRSIRQSHQSPKLPIALSTPKRDSVSMTQRYERELGYKWGIPGAPNMAMMSLGHSRDTGFHLSSTQSSAILSPRPLIVTARTD